MLIDPVWLSCSLEKHIRWNWKSLICRNYKVLSCFLWLCTWTENLFICLGLCKTIVSWSDHIVSKSARYSIFFSLEVVPQLKICRILLSSAPDEEVLPHSAPAVFMYCQAQTQKLLVSKLVRWIYLICTMYWNLYNFSDECNIDELQCKVFWLLF